MDTSVGVEVMYRLKYGLDDTCGFHSKETTRGSGPFDDSINYQTVHRRCTCPSRCVRVRCLQRHRRDNDKLDDGFMIDGADNSSISRYK